LCSEPVLDLIGDVFVVKKKKPDPKAGLGKSVSRILSFAYQAK